MKILTYHLLSLRNRLFLFLSKAVLSLSLSRNGSTGLRNFANVVEVLISHLLHHLDSCYSAMFLPR